MSKPEPNFSRRLVVFACIIKPFIGKVIFGVQPSTTVFHVLVYSMSSTHLQYSDLKLSIEFHNTSIDDIIPQSHHYSHQFSHTQYNY